MEKAMSKTVCTYMIQQVCSAAEIDNTVNQLHFNKIIKKKKKLNKKKKDLDIP